MDENKNVSSGSVAKLKKIYGLFPVAAAFVALTIFSWRKWPDVLIDFGLQLYTPWQLTNGKILYRDVMHLAGGPFSQYFNALLFQVFGVSFTTLIVANLFLIAVLLFLLHHFFSKISDQITATSICLVVVLVFAFSEYLQIGNYNYVTPYTHETLHSLILSLGAILLFSRWLLRKSITAIFFAGCCFGLVFLTKPESFLALFASASAAFFFGFNQERFSRWLAKSATAFALGTAIPIGIAFAGFRSVENNFAAFQAIAWAWIPLFTTSAANNDFYRSTLGLDDIGPNLVLAGTQFLGYGFCLALCAWVSRRSPDRPQREKIFSLLIFAGLAIAAFTYKWFEGGRALLFFTPTIGALLFWLWKKVPARNCELIPAILWFVFAFVLLAKTGVHSRIWHYGFYLDMPATILAIYFVGWLLPGMLRRWNVHPGTFRLIVFCLLAIGTLRLVLISNNFYQAKTFAIGGGADKIFSYPARIDPTAPAMQAALNWIEKNSAEDATLAVLPEGVMLNYLSRRVNPTPYINVTFPVWQAFGEEEILSAFQKQNPDFIALVHRDASEYGVEFFGKTERYGLKTMRWINQNYTPVQLIGREPLQDGAFGIKILKLNKKNLSHNLREKFSSG
ncbi:MAG: hypothetical protein ABIR24_09825 [Verrucomicrobiota bacterium]